MKFSFVGFGLAALVAVVPWVAQANVTILDKDRWKVMVNGFAELQMFHDSTRDLSETTGNFPISLRGVSSGFANNGRTQFSARASRLGLTIQAPDLDGVHSRGVFEIDFMGTQGGLPTEAGFFNNAVPRLRHAAAFLENNGWELMAGQYWDLLGFQPLFEAASATLPPIAGLVFSRAPQLRLTKTMTVSSEEVLKAAVAIVRPVQRDSEIPNLNLGVLYTNGNRRGAYLSRFAVMESQPMAIGISGTVRDLTKPEDLLNGDKVHYLGGAIVADAMLPILPADGMDPAGALTVVGEYSRGVGDADYFLGFTGNLSANPSGANLDAGLAGNSLATGTFQLVNLQSFSVGVQYHLPKGWHTYVNFIYGQTFSNNSTQLGAASGKQTFDQSEVYLANVFHSFTDAARFGFEVQHLTTRYNTGAFGINDRVQVSGWFHF